MIFWFGLVRFWELRNAADIKQIKKKPLISNPPANSPLDIQHKFLAQTCHRNEQQLNMQQARNTDNAEEKAGCCLPLMGYF